VGFSANLVIATPSTGFDPKVMEAEFRAAREALLGIITPMEDRLVHAVYDDNRISLLSHELLDEMPKLIPSATASYVHDVPYLINAVLNIAAGVTVLCIIGANNPDSLEEQLRIQAALKAAVHDTRGPLMVVYWQIGDDRADVGWLTIATATDTRSGHYQNFVVMDGDTAQRATWVAHGMRRWFMFLDIARGAAITRVD
jgi:hypothetical protein